MSTPALLGKYVLLERLAAGGMGEVFLARAGAKGFERFFALKRILAQHAESPEFVQMLMNEARISVKLVHPNIAQVFEFGQIEQSFFMALELVEGLSLNAIIRRAREQGMSIRPADAVWIAVQICRALHYAHNKRDDDGHDLQIIHRDISPHNILVDEGGSVKLIDFGIAKASQGQIQTEASTIKGKIPYMSPEQASGETLDPRSDLYALGIVLYECLTLERMYPSGNTFETFAMVRKGRIPDLEDKLRGKVPDALFAVVAKALQRERAQRFQTAAEMESELQRILSTLEPGYTSYALADFVLKLDHDRAERKARLKQYADISAEELLRAAGTAQAAAEQKEPSGKVLVPPLPVDVTLGSLAQTVRGKTPISQRSVVTAVPEQLQSGSIALPQRNLAPLVAAAFAGAAAVLGLLLLVTRNEQPMPSPPPTVEPAPPAPAPVPLAAPPTPPPPALTPPALTPTAPTPPLDATSPAGTHKKPPKKKPVTSAPAKEDQGCVAVNAAPWAHVSEGGRRLGTTPLPCLELSVGKHTLVLDNPVAGQTRTVTVTVQSGETARVFERF